MFIPAHELVLAAKATVSEIPPAEAAAWLAGSAATSALVLDVREADEFAQGHLPGAINIPRGLLEFRISNDTGLQDVARPILLYCKTSGRAALSAVALRAMGFTAVRSVAGGFDAWAAAGLPVARPEAISFE